MGKAVGKKRVLLLVALSFGLTMLVYGPIKRALMGTKSSEVKEAPSQVFYANHVASVLNNHCVTCHRANGSAPFALTSYEKVFRKKKTIKKVVERGIMPPWPADPNYSHFLGERQQQTSNSANIQFNIHFGRARCYCRHGFNFCQRG